MGIWLVLCSAPLFAQNYSTRTAEHRTLFFEEGIIAHLNTRTRVLRLPDMPGRCVELLEGEALFEVQRDSERPFSVCVEQSEIQAPGARFNIYRKQTGEVVVTVLEGSVKVQATRRGKLAWKRELQANQRIVYGPKGIVRDAQNIAALNVMRWQEGKLEIEDEPLSKVIDELGRYMDRPLLIRDRRLKRLRIGGVLDVRDPATALSRLEKLGPVKVVETPDGYLLEYQSSPAEPTH